MNPKRIVIVSTYVLLLALLVFGGSSCLFSSFLGKDNGGTGGGAGEITEMMNRVPSDVESFGFFDMETMRTDDEVEYLYSYLNGILFLVTGMCGVDLPDVQRFAAGDETMLFEGEFDIPEMRQELEEDGYDQGEYLSVEVWEKSSDYFSFSDSHIALWDDLVISGDEDGVNGCIDVIQGGDDSLYDKDSFKDVVDRLPKGAMYLLEASAFLDEGYDGLEASGMSVGGNDGSTLEMTGVLKFEDENAAQSTMDNFETDLENNEGDLRNIDLEQDGQFVTVTFEQDVEDMIDESTSQGGPDDGSEDDIDILSHTGSVDDWDHYTVAGEVRNAGSDNLEWVVLTATFYDSSGVEIGTSFAYTTINTLVPGQKSPFEITLWDTLVVASVASYEIVCNQCNITDEYTNGEFEIISHALGTDAYGYNIVVGEVKNTGSQTVTSVMIVGTFYDASGKVITTEYTWESPSDGLAPVEVTPFEMTLYDESVFQDIVSYELQAQSGW